MVMELDWRLPLPEQTKPNTYSVKHLSWLYLLIQYIQSVYFSHLFASLHFGDPEVILSLTIFSFSNLRARNFLTKSLCISHTKYHSRVSSDLKKFSFSVLSINRRDGRNPASDKIPSAVPLLTVTLKLPMFWTDFLEVWFLQAKLSLKTKE